MFMTIVMVITFAMPVAAHGFDPLDNIFDLTDSGVTMGDNKNDTPHTLPDTPHNDGADTPQDEQEKESSEGINPVHGQSGTIEVEDEAALLAAMQAWIEGLRFTQF